MKQDFSSQTLFPRLLFMTADFLLGVDKTTANEDNNMRGKSFTLMGSTCADFSSFTWLQKKLEITQQLVCSRLCSMSTDTTQEGTRAKMVSEDKSPSCTNSFNYLENGAAY